MPGLSVMKPFPSTRPSPCELSEALKNREKCDILAETVGPRRNVFASQQVPQREHRPHVMYEERLGRICRRLLHAGETCFALR